VVSTSTDIAERIEVIKRRDAYETDHQAFAKKWSRQDGKLRRKIVNAREALGTIAVDDSILGTAARICIALETDGSRGELTLIRAARALAALDGDTVVENEHLRRVSHMALGHRLRRNPLDESSAGVRVDRVLDQVLAE
jgi:magnesium chelatase subunit I